MRSSTRSNKRLRTILIAVLAVIITLALAKSLYHWLATRSQKEPPIIIQTVRVKEAAVPLMIETVGSLTSEKELKIKAAGPGKISKRLVKSGAFVKAGTEILTIVGGPEIRAPFDGYLNDWLVKEGDYVVAGTELVDFVNTDVLSLSYIVPEHYAALLDLNQEVALSLRAFPEQRFSGKVNFVAPRVDKKTGSILIRAEIMNNDQILWPGMTAHVQHILAENPKALVVPESALELTLEGYQLKVVEGDKLALRKVQIGHRSPGRVEIKQGVKLSEQVLLTRNEQTEEGKTVVGEDWQGEW
jgi:multidrug efflux pump subunit AcrA (membrane-fusion protein)